MAAEKRYTSLSINVPSPLLTKLDDIVRANKPFGRRHAIHLAALLIGLEVVGARPDHLARALETIERLREAA